MRIAIYKQGHKTTVDNSSDNSAIVEVVLDDDRTVQLSVQNDGSVFLRGWGNVPAKVGNWNRLNLAAKIEKEAATTCEVCHCPLDGGPEKGRCQCERPTN